MSDPRDVAQIGPYRVIRYIDEGAFAWVYEVVDPKFPGRRLALKVLKPEAAVGEEFRRFERESQLLAGIDHPSIVTIFDFGRDPETDFFYYTMTYVDGPTLKKRLAEGPMPTEEALRVFVDLLDGLEHLHQRGIVHRDIKPANVLIGSDGRARLSDLGIARVQTESGQTRTGVAVGTALYMSPEQARGRPVDGRSDLFSAGLTLYETLTGNVVYEHVEDIDSTSGMDVLIYIGRLDQQQAEFHVTFPDTPAVPEAVKEVIRRACHLRAADRYRSAADMRDAVRRALEGPEPTRTAAPPPPPRERRWVVAASGALALALAAVLVFRWWAGVQELQLAEQRFQAVSALEARVARLVDRVRDLLPPPPRELLDNVETDRDRAAESLVDARENLQAGIAPTAAWNLGEAEEGFFAACDRLAGFAFERADEFEAELTARALAARERGAAGVARDAWRAFDTALSELRVPDPPPSGCDAVEVHLERLASGVVAADLAAAVDEEVAAAWPALAARSRQAAATARQRAAAEPVEAAEYRDALREGVELQRTGDQKVRSEAFREARAAYEAAIAQFRTAQEVAPAARARAEVRSLAAEADMDSLVRPLAHADELYAAGQWVRAAEAYRQTRDRILDQQAVRAQQLAAAEERRRAEAERTKAAEGGAAASASESFARAVQQAARAEEHADAERYREAREWFVAARELFALSLQESIQALGDARQALAEANVLATARRPEAGCTGFELATAQAECARGDAELGEAAAALEQFDAPRVLQHVAAAREAIDRAAELYAARPQPPALEERSPARQAVEVKRGEVRSFAVRASDPNGDSLRVEWTLDGAPVAAGPKLELRFEQNGVVAAKVSDGQHELVETWEVTVAVPRPILTLSPSAGAVRLKPGGRLTLRASAHDPDGSPVHVEIQRSGAVVSRGQEAAGEAEYVFDAAGPGSHRVAVLARNREGVESRAVWNVRVASPTPPPAQPLEPFDATPYTGWRRNVAQALKKYERALQSCDMKALGEVLALGDDSRVLDRYRRRCESGEQVEVVLSVEGEIEGSERNATVVFTQRERTEKGDRSYRYRATLRRPLLGTGWKMRARERV